MNISAMKTIYVVLKSPPYSLYIYLSISFMSLWIFLFSLLQSFLLMAFGMSFAAVIKVLVVNALNESLEPTVICSNTPATSVWVLFDGPIDDCCLEFPRLALRLFLSLWVFFCFDFWLWGPHLDTQILDIFQAVSTG